VARPSLRVLTLGEVAHSEIVLESLIAENETLFVEHKAGIEKGDGYQLAKAIGSFANTLGGWVIVGVRDGQLDPSWQPPRGGFVDAVRQRLEGQLDPLPSFAADVLDLNDGRIGVVRVYESTDTPHILRADGSVVVREPAQDAKLRKRGKYEAMPIRSHYELAQLMQRGRVAEEAAVERLQRRKLPFLQDSMGFRWTGGMNQDALVEAPPAGPALVLRASPLNVSPPWREWCVSRPGVNAVTKLVEAISSDPLDVDDPLPHPTGAAIAAKERHSARWVPDGHRLFLRTGVAAVDGGGGIGLRLGFEIQKIGGLTYDWRKLSDDGELEALLSPLVAAMSTVLTDAELLGRYAVNLLWIGMNHLFRLEPENAGEGSPSGHVPSGGLLTVDGLEDSGERDDLVRRWSEELLRASGLAVWRAD
jgi:schlafen family protein